MMDDDYDDDGEMVSNVIPTPDEWEACFYMIMKNLNIKHSPQNNLSSSATKATGDVQAAGNSSSASVVTAAGVGIRKNSMNDQSITEAGITTNLQNERMVMAICASNYKYKTEYLKCIISYYFNWLNIAYKNKVSAEKEEEDDSPQQLNDKKRKRDKEDKDERSNQKHYIAIIDSNCYKSEYYVPGTVYLHIVDSDSFFDEYKFMNAKQTCYHQSKSIHKSYFLGEEIIMTQPHVYLKAIGELYQEYNTNIKENKEYLSGNLVKQVPLLFLSSDYTSSFERELLNQILTMISPSYFISIDAADKQSRHGMHTKFLQDCKCFYLQPNSIPHSIPALPSDSVQRRFEYFARYLMRKQPATGFTSYPSTVNEFEEYFSKWLVDSNPYAVGIDNMKIIDVTYECLWNNTGSKKDVFKDHSDKATKTMKMMNGMIVGLCKSSKDLENDTEKDSSCIPCLGIGLVIGIDESKGVVYIHTPIHFHALKQVNTIVLSKMEFISKVITKRSLNGETPYIDNTSVIFSL